TLVAPDLLRCIRQGVVRGVQRIDLLELEEGPVRHAARVVDFSALEQVQENVEGGRPSAGAYGRAGLGQGLRDREAVASVVSHPRHQGPFASEIDAQHRVATSIQMKKRAATGISCG